MDKQNIAEIVKGLRNKQIDEARYRNAPYVLGQSHLAGKAETKRYGTLKAIANQNQFGGGRYNMEEETPKPTNIRSKVLAKMKKLKSEESTENLGTTDTNGSKKKGSDTVTVSPEYSDTPSRP